jgi:NTP pyrophosphatase (non-canonical NTP hydrolase)
MPTLTDLTARILQFRDERDWRQFHRPKDLVLALGIETSELAEHFLWKDEAACENLAGDPAAASAVAEELADVMIYALLLADRLGIDPETAILDKLEKNAVKYPVAESRGSARKYTEFER